MQYWAYVDESLLKMFVMDHHSEIVVEDIIDHKLPRLEAADERLAGFGYVRRGAWERYLRYHVAEVTRT